MLDAFLGSRDGEIVGNVGRSERSLGRLQNHLMSGVKAQKPSKKGWLSMRLRSELVYRECGVGVFAKEVEYSKIDAGLGGCQWEVLFINSTNDQF